MMDATERYASEVAKETRGKTSITRTRRIVLGIVGAVLILLTAGPPEFEAFMAITGWSSELDGGAHKLHIIMRGFGALFLGVIAGAVLIVRPSLALGTAMVWAAAIVAYPLAAILGMTDWPAAFIMPVLSVIVVGVVLWALRNSAYTAQLSKVRSNASSTMMIAAMVIAIPLIVYGLNEASLQRSSETLHGDLWHWAGSSMKAFMVVLMALIASLRLPGWRVPAWGAGFLLAALGAVSAALPNQASSIGTAWGMAAIVAAIGFVALAEYQDRAASVPAPVSGHQPAH